MRPALRVPLSRYIPHRPTPRQAAFLVLPHREAFFGGALGGGKSEALLMAALQGVEVPGYRAVLVRDSFAAMEEAGALVDRARGWLLGTDATWSATDRMWRFPSGAVLSFRPLRDEGDERAFMGTEYQFIGVDEVTNLAEAQYTFLLTRLRRPAGSAIPLRIRSTGMPYGPGVDWVRRRFVDGASEEVAFVASRMEDNPHLDRDSYRQMLEALDPVTRARMLEGDWTVRPEGGLFRRAWFDGRTVEERDLPPWLGLCRYWDLASSEARNGADPDYTAGALVGMSEDGLFWVLDVTRLRDTPLGVQRAVRRAAERDAAWADSRGWGRPAIRMEQEPGSAGAAVIDLYAREVLGGFDFAGIRPTGSKLTRARPVAGAVEGGRVFLLRGAWNGELVDEVCAFPMGPHDDQVDALAGAMTWLWEEREETYIVVYDDPVEISPY